MKPQDLTSSLLKSDTKIIQYNVADDSVLTRLSAFIFVFKMVYIIFETNVRYARRFYRTPHLVGCLYKELRKAMGKPERKSVNMRIKSFFKVIVVRVDVFESEIWDERHFSDRGEAVKFCDEMRNTPGMSAIVVEM